MKITYKTNHVETTKSLTEWYFGKEFVARLTRSSESMREKTGESSFEFWQNGTGILTIVFEG